MKKLILDEAKWICGNPYSDKNRTNHRGKGDTFLLNQEGFMCCLGQFSLQIEPELKPCELLGIPSPRGIKDHLIPLLCDEHRLSTGLASDAITINDDSTTTVQEKVRLLKELFAKHNFEIEFIPDKNREVGKGNELPELS